MVGTRSHPSGEFPATPTPGSRSPSTSLVPASSKKSRSSSGGWTHTPSTLTLLWLTLSIPIVCWDTAYVLGRPATMPGGWAHAPLFTPYALYGTIDYVYGMPSIVNRDGFGYAQGAMNMVETAGYLWYLYLVFVNGETARRGSGRGAPKDGGAFAKVLGPLVRPRVVDGRAAAVAPVVGLLMSALTLAKTVLYWLNEYYSGFKNVGHNDLFTLVFLWMIPNGMWLIFPTYTMYVFYQEVVDGLEASTGVDAKKHR